MPQAPKKPFEILQQRQKKQNTVQKNCTVLPEIFASTAKTPHRQGVPATQKTKKIRNAHGIPYHVRRYEKFRT